VIALGKDYDYAVVGTPDRKYLWILSRTPQMEPNTYDAVVAEAKSQGFNVSALMKTRHTARPSGGAGRLELPHVVARKRQTG
jgi:apolipoprotein D and lipocalin family protein